MMVWGCILPLSSPTHCLRSYSDYCWMGGQCDNTSNDVLSKMTSGETTISNQQCLFITHSPTNPTQFKMAANNNYRPQSGRLSTATLADSTRPFSANR